MKERGLSTAIVIQILIFTLSSYSFRLPIPYYHPNYLKKARALSIFSSNNEEFDDDDDPFDDFKNNDDDDDDNEEKQQKILQLQSIWNQDDNSRNSLYSSDSSSSFRSMQVDLTKISLGEPDYHSYTFHRNMIPNYFIDSVKEGEVTMPEVNQQFQPTNDDIQVITTNSHAKGYVGCIFLLETSILRIEQFYITAFRQFLVEIEGEEDEDEENSYSSSQRITDEAIIDAIGLPFREFLIESYLPSVNPNDEYQLNLLEKKFFLIFEKLIDRYSSEIQIIPSFQRFIDLLQAEENTMIIMTNLPRYIATKLITISSLSRFFEGRIPIQNFITPKRDVFTIDFRKYLMEQERKEQLKRQQSRQQRGRYEVEEEEEEEELTEEEKRAIRDDAMFNHIYFPQYGDQYQSKQFAIACAIMRKHCALTILFDRNRQNINLAKKLGMACIGMKEEEDAIFLHDENEANYYIGNDNLDEETRAAIEELKALRAFERQKSFFSLKLRGTDYQIQDYTEITIEKLYEIMRRYVQWINGPQLKRKEAPKKPPVRLKQTILFADDFPEEIAKEKERRMRKNTPLIAMDFSKAEVTEDEVSRNNNNKLKEGGDEEDISEEGLEREETDTGSIFQDTFFQLTRHLPSSNQDENLGFLLTRRGKNQKPDQPSNSKTVPSSSSRSKDQKQTDDGLEDDSNNNNDTEEALDFLFSPVKDEADDNEESSDEEWNEDEEDGILPAKSSPTKKQSSQTPPKPIKQPVSFLFDFFRRSSDGKKDETNNQKIDGNMDKQEEKEEDEEEEEEIEEDMFEDLFESGDEGKDDEGEWKGFDFDGEDVEDERVLMESGLEEADGEEDGYVISSENIRKRDSAASDNNQIKKKRNKKDKITPYDFLD